VMVYHPNQGNGHAFANVGFIGWIGALTGQSSAQMAISEIGAVLLRCSLLAWLLARSPPPPTLCRVQVSPSLTTPSAT
jgi:hypothetical protein